MGTDIAVGGVTELNLSADVAQAREEMLVGRSELGSSDDESRRSYEGGNGHSIAT